MSRGGGVRVRLYVAQMSSPYDTHPEKISIGGTKVRVGVSVLVQLSMTSDLRDPSSYDLVILLDTLKWFRNKF